MTAVAEVTTHDRLEFVWRDDPGILGFIKTVDHKRIGKRYLATSLFFLVLGGMQAMLMRVQLIGPGREVLSPELYNQMMTMHGVTMIFLFNTPIWAGFGNYFLPLQIGTRDMAFPRMNALSYWIFLFAGIFLYSSLLVAAMPNNGWFAYPPFSNRTYNPGLNMDFFAIGIAFLGVSTTVGAVNFIVTTFKMRAPGMTASRIPVFTWGILLMSFMIIFAVPAVTLSQVLLEIERALGFTFYNASNGGDPMLYQHLFWIWGHPEVYIVFLPATAVVSQIIPVFSRRPLAAYLLVITALVSITFLSFGVWVHHMFATGLGFAALSFFSAASMMVSIPSGTQFFAWIATMWRGRPRFPTSMLFCIAMMFIFLAGGITGVMVAMIPADLQEHDTYFVVAHFHYVLAGGSVLPIFAGLYYWLPKITGKLNSEFLGKISFWLIMIGFNVGFFPMHMLGLMGMTRRIYTYPPGLGWEGMNMAATIGSFIMAVGYGLSLFNYLWSYRRGMEAGPNPWGAGELEWATTSPPPSYNFLEMPEVRSRHPLWDDRHEEGIVVEPSHNRPVLMPPEGEIEHFTLATGGVDSAPEAVMAMPPPTVWPFVLALGMTVISYGILVRFVWLIVPGVLVMGWALAGWFWPTYSQDEDIHLAEVPG